MTDAASGPAIPAHRWSQRRSLIYLAALAFGFVANVHLALSLGMHRDVPGWHIGGIIAALSSSHFNHRVDYTALVDVRERFLEKLSSSSSTTVDAAIAHTLATDPAMVSRRIYTLGADDKGVVDFVRLSFEVFGYKSERFLYLYFAIMAISALAFVIAFHDQRWALLLLATFFASHLMLLRPVLANPELKSVLALRFMPVLSMIACLHLILATMRGRPRLLDWSLIVAQVIVISFVLHVRFSTAWQLGPVCLATAIVLFIRVRRKSTEISVEANRPLTTILGPLLCLVAGVLAVKVYEHATHAEAYKRGDEIAGHVIWHSFYSGLAFHPSLAREYAIRIDDVSVMAALGKYLSKRGRFDEYESIGGTSPGFSRIRFAPYDKLVREMLVATCWSHLRDCAEAMFYYRPRALAHYIGWLIRVIPDTPYIELVNSDAQNAFKSMTVAMDKGLAAKPFDWRILLMLGPFLLIGTKQARISRRPIAMVLLPFVIGALSPAVLVYPMPHTIGEPVIGLAMIFYVATVLGVAWILGMYMRPRSSLSAV